MAWAVGVALFGLASFRIPDFELTGNDKDLRRRNPDCRFGWMLDRPHEIGEDE